MSPGYIKKKENVNMPFSTFNKQKIDIKLKNIRDARPFFRESKYLMGAFKDNQV